MSYIPLPVRWLHWKKKPSLKCLSIWVVEQETNVLLYTTMFDIKLRVETNISLSISILNLDSNEDQCCQKIRKKVLVQFISVFSRL